MEDLVYYYSCCSLLLIAALPILLFLFKSPTSSHHLPPGPWNLPILGSIHHFFNSEPPHRSLRRLSATHGPIMHLWLGELPAVVISSAGAAREVMRTHDPAFAARPCSAADGISYGGRDVAFAPYNELWRQMRRICVLELLCARRVRSFAAMREEELLILFRSIASDDCRLVNLSNGIARLSNNIAVRAAVGGKYCTEELQSSYLTALSQGLELLSGFNAVGFFPSMPILARIRGLRGRLERCHNEIDRVLEAIIQQHREKRSKGHGSSDDVKGSSEEVEADDLLDVLLRIQQDGSTLHVPLSIDNIKAILNDMLAGGGETTTSTLEWAMSELIRNPNAMRIAQSEVREFFTGILDSKVIADDRQEEINKLSYLQLVIKETLRLHPPVPLLPRECREGCEVLGYWIPTKTKVMLNVWAIGRDPEIWDDPEVFKPERFQGSLLDFKGAHFEFIPFGAGRRICPGMQFGLATIELVLANLLYYFDWECPEKGELDMTEGLARRKSALILRAIPYTPIPTV